MKSILAQQAEHSESCEDSGAWHATQAGGTRKSATDPAARRNADAATEAAIDTAVAAFMPIRPYAGYALVHTPC